MGLPYGLYASDSVGPISPNQKTLRLFGRVLHRRTLKSCSERHRSEHGINMPDRLSRPAPTLTCTMPSRESMSPCLVTGPNAMSVEHVIPAGQLSLREFYPRVTLRRARRPFGGELQRSPKLTRANELGAIREATAIAV